MELVSTVPKSNVFCDLWMAYDKMNKKKKKKKKKKKWSLITEWVVITKLL